MTDLDDAVRRALRHEADRILADAKAARPRGIWLPDDTVHVLPERDGAEVVYTITDLPLDPTRPETREHRPAELSPHFVTPEDQ